MLHLLLYANMNNMRVQPLLLIALLIIQPALAEVDSDWEEESTGPVQQAVISPTKRTFNLSAETKVVRPDWIPASAYTDQELITQLHLRLGFRTIPMGWRLKSKKTEHPLLKKTLSHWHGAYKPRSVIVMTVPVPQYPGNFYFYDIKKPYEGPRGWLEEIPPDDKHKWRYRYWFDESPVPSWVPLK